MASRDHFIYGRKTDDGTQANIIHQGHFYYKTAQMKWSYTAATRSRHLLEI